MKICVPPWTRHILTSADRAEIAAASPADFRVTIQRADNWHRGWNVTIWNPVSQAVARVVNAPDPLDAFRACLAQLAPETVRWRDCEVVVS